MAMSVPSYLVTLLALSSSPTLLERSLNMTDTSWQLPSLASSSGSSSLGLNHSSESESGSSSLEGGGSSGTCTDTELIDESYMHNPALPGRLAGPDFPTRRRCSQPS